MSLRADLYKSLREACERRGLVLEVTSSHPTKSRPIHHGPIEWLDVAATDPKSPTLEVHASTIDPEKINEFLRAVISEVRRTWPLSKRGGANATAAHRAAKKARLEAEFATARGLR
jgi:hypothetical protein